MLFAEIEQDGGGFVHDAAILDQCGHPGIGIELQVLRRFLLTAVDIDLDQLERHAHFDHRGMTDHVGAALAPVERIHRYPLAASASSRPIRKSKNAGASPCSSTLQGPSSRQSNTVSPLLPPFVSTRIAARLPENSPGFRSQATVSGSCRCSSPL